MHVNNDCNPSAKLYEPLKGMRFFMQLNSKHTVYVKYFDKLM
jgi:hypothetical protein